ncbi:MAG: PEBP family protein [Anaerolineaceae bacterium]|nr:PEBP family protein [Anaerolineaceae bacterium]MCB9100250.1 PEBP family protein [Anaerolineales bacterium]
MTKFTQVLAFCTLLLLLFGCGGGGRPPGPPGPPPNNSNTLNQTTANTNGAVTFKLDGWADNWFAAYLGEELIVEDSVPITTERSFNAESVTFKADYPLHLNFILKDYKENDTGLEYIGAGNQQMGDGGFIMQLTDTGSGHVVAVSNGEWKCTIIHEAPLDKACENVSNPVAGTVPCEFSALEEPAGWKSADFDDSGWTATTIHSASEVGPKDGYDQIRWDSRAQLIWGPDLETDNTLLCRVTVDAP